MKARVLCPHCKVQGRLIRLTETSGDKLNVVTAGTPTPARKSPSSTKTRRAPFAEAAAKVRNNP